MDSLKVNPLKYPNMQCDKCGHDVFHSGIILKKIPGIVMGTGGDDQIIDLPVYVCDKCGAVLKEYREAYKLEEFAEANEQDNSAEEKPKSKLIL